jgi:Permuted papain-like amidase enzyme, YaeF/YiiX, C92 family
VASGGRAPLMADPLKKKEIAALPVKRYEEVRTEIRSGDLAFCSGSYVLSRFIQRFTGSVWSHVGLIYRDDHLRRVFLLESEVGIGVRLVPISKYLRDYHGRRRPYRGQMVIARVNPALGDEQVRDAVSYGMDLLTKPYDNFEILRIAARIAFRIGRRTQDRKFICSELVDECYRAAGVKFKRRDNFISPDDIWRDAVVSRIARIH